VDKHPVIHRLDLGHVMLPADHPRATDRTAPLHAFAIEHPDGVVLFDCGCGTDSAEVNAFYSPKVIALEDALKRVGIGIAAIKAVVLSHLHFDHCGQLGLLRGRPVYVQRAELDAAKAPDYTVAGWAAIPAADCRALDGDETIAAGLTVIATPGHTPGHQSLVVRGGGETTIVGGQCCYCAEGITRFEPDNLFSTHWETAARDSIRKLLSLNPRRILLSHDTRPWTAS
jgi:N-acyl homoserine lactone hydrolase